MIKANINYNNLSIEIIGHSNNILCARVSTLMQYTSMLFNDTVLTKNKEIFEGYSYLEFTKIGESVFVVLVKAIRELKEMYPNNLEIKEIKNE